VGRLVTIAAPIVAELDRPLPVLFLLCFNVIAIMASAFLPSAKEVEEYQTG